MANSQKEFKDKLTQSLNDNNIEETSVKNTSVVEGRIKLKKKVEDKKNKKSFNVYMEPEIVTGLDRMAKRSGYSRNELISIACKHFVDNCDLED